MTENLAAPPGPIGRLVAALTCAATVLLAAPPAEAKRDMRVALAVTTRVNVSRGQAERITRAFTHALERRLRVRVSRTAEVPPDCLETGDCLRRLARSARAQRVLLLVIVRLGDRIQVQVTWADPSRSETAVREPILLEPDGADPAVALATRATSWLPEAEPRSRARHRKDSRRHARAPSAAPSPVSGARRRRPEEPRETSLGVWIAGGVSLASLAGGLAFAYRADDGYGSLKGDGCAETVCDPERLRQLDRDALFADVLLGTAVAAGAAAAVFHFTANHGKPSKPPISARPLSGGAVVTWGGKF